MSPFTHLVGSWLVASVTTHNPRDRKLVTWAGVVPDADGLGAVVDVIGSWMTGKECMFYYYQTYHHLLLHGWPAALVVSLLLSGFARERFRVLFWCLIVFHLHLACDLLGSRGPDTTDLWPICYSEPLLRHPIWFWKGQWRLDGWQNRLVFLGLFSTAIWLTLKRGYSFVEVISQRADAVFVLVLRGWRDRLQKR